MATNEQRDLICRMAAHYLMTVAVVTEAERSGERTAELEAEAKRAGSSLIAALHLAGYMNGYLGVGCGGLRAPSTLEH